MPTIEEIAAYRPRNIDETLEAMRSALDFFHTHNDHRAIFLRMYYLITLEAHDALQGRGRYTHRLFFDPEWINHDAGNFSSLYFMSLSTEQRKGERAWKTAHRLAAGKDTSVLQDMLLGLNAHINYDLAYSIYVTMKQHDDGRDHLLMHRRKFDHDQVNNLLINCIPRIEEVITRDYGGEVLALGTLVGNLEHVLAGAGLKYYRDRIWWSALSFLATKTEAEVQLVRDRLDWESAQLAESLSCEGAPLQSALSEVFQLFRKKKVGRITLEREANEGTRRKPTQAVSPF